MGAGEWSTPEMVADMADFPLWNPVLFKYPLTGPYMKINTT